MKQIAHFIQEYGFSISIVPYRVFLQTQKEFEDNQSSDDQSSSKKKEHALQVLRPYFTKNGWNPDHGIISNEHMLKAAHLDHPPPINKLHFFRLFDFLVSNQVVSK